LWQKGFKSNTWRVWLAGHVYLEIFTGVYAAWLEENFEMDPFNKIGWISLDPSMVQGDLPYFVQQIPFFSKARI